MPDVDASGNAQLEASKPLRRPGRGPKSAALPMPAHDATARVAAGQDGRFSQEHPDAPKPGERSGPQENA